MQRKLLYPSLVLNLLFLVGAIFAVQMLGGWRFVWYKMQHRGLAADYEHRFQLLATMELEKGDIVFLGNSITAYCEWAELLGNPRIKNRGIPGDATDGVLSRLDPILAAEPAQIFLMIGVNDLLFHPRERVVDNYQKIIERILHGSPETALFIQSILPVNNQLRSSGISNADILWINTALQELATKFQVNYLDIHQLLLDEQGRLNAKYSSDGIHLNGAAYQIWKKALQPLVR